MTKLLLRFWDDGSGATALEYGLITLIMSAGIVAGIPALRDAVQSLYMNVSASMASAGT